MGTSESPSSDIPCGITMGWTFATEPSQSCPRCLFCARAPILLPILPVERAIPHRFGDVFGLELFAPAQAAMVRETLRMRSCPCRYQLLTEHELPMARCEERALVFLSLVTLMSG